MADSPQPNQVRNAPSHHQEQRRLARNSRGVCKLKRPVARLGGCRALGRARARASFGARLGADEACGRATQRVGNDAWRQKSPQPSGLSLQWGAGVVANARDTYWYHCALRLACSPMQAQRRPDPKPDRLLEHMEEALHLPVCAMPINEFGALVKAGHLKVCHQPPANGLRTCGHSVWRSGAVAHTAGTRRVRSTAASAGRQPQGVSWPDAALTPWASSKPTVCQMRDRLLSCQSHCQSTIEFREFCRSIEFISN